MRPVSRTARSRRQYGFTLFEMVVSICAIAILYMIAERRINELPGAAERANFQAVLEQIKTGVNLAMISRMADGRTGELQDMQGDNPMDFLLEGPSNYLGTLEVVTDAVRRRNAWYYETSTGDLVYVVGGGSINDVLVTVAGVRVKMGQIRFRIENLYAGHDGLVRGSALEDARGDLRWQGLQLVPVHEYSWERSADLGLQP